MKNLASKLADWCGVGMQAINETKPYMERVEGDGGDPRPVTIGPNIPDDEPVLPAEALPVYRVRTFGRDPQTGARLLTQNRKFTGEGQFAYGHIVAGRGSLWREAAALAFMTKGRNDIRPALLLLMQA